MPTVYLKGQPIRLDPRMSIGKGGEAEVFNIGRGRALKVFHAPDSPEFENKPLAQEAARIRIAEHQTKLLQIPQDLPSEILLPGDLGYTKPTGGNINSYDMEFLYAWEVLMQYSQKPFRQAGVPNDHVIQIFRKLYDIVRRTHLKHVVFGDFNDLNVFVKWQDVLQQYDVRIGDFDSAQWGRFLCKVFTTRFVDPLLCDPNDTKLVLKQTHTKMSDWYAYLVMLMQSLLYVDPYGGIYNAPKGYPKIPHTQRPLQRITVFNQYVKYPGIATHYSVLPDELLDLFHRVFEKDERKEFPIAVLENIHWTTCSQCGKEHARRTCPVCQTVAPVPVIVGTKTIHGKVTSTDIFSTIRGTIVYATYQHGTIRFLYYEDGEFRRENRTTVVKLLIDPHLIYRIRDKETYIAKRETVRIFSPGKPMETMLVDPYYTGMLPSFDVNETSKFWVENGMLLTEGQFSPVRVGDVLSSQTRFWVGSHLGFGFYRVGTIMNGFVFVPGRPGVNDSVKLPLIQGQLVDTHCLFSRDQCWFFLSVIEHGQQINHCIVIRIDGTIESYASTEEGDGSWLGTIKGKCILAGKFMFAATDAGLVRVDILNGNLVKAREYPDTLPFVDSGTHLIAGSNGIYIIGRREISLLQIS